MKKYGAIIVGLFQVAVLMAGCTGLPGETGCLRFLLSDDDGETTAIGDFSSIIITVSGIGFHQGGESGNWTEPEGYVPWTGDLLDLVGTNATVIWEGYIEAGYYTKAFIYVSNVTGTLPPELGGGEADIWIPSGKFQITMPEIPFTVTEDGAIVDFVFDITEDLTFQAAQSRAIRNVVLAGVPRWLTDQSKERAKEAVLKGISKEGLAAATDKALKFLAGYGVSEARVIAALGKAKQSWTSEDIATLRGLASQLKDGQATAEQLFPVPEVKEERAPAAASEPKGKKNRAAKVSGPGGASPSAPLLAQPATAEQLNAIRVACLDKEIDLDVVFQQWHLSQLEDLDVDQAREVEVWLAGQ